MRLFLASDIHGAHRKLNSALSQSDIDVVILAGDLSNGSMSEVRGIVKTALDHLERVYFVPGNMDPPSLLEVDELEGAINLHGRSVKLDSLRLGGIGGGNISPFNTPIEFDEEEIEEFLSRLGQVDVLVSHAPPKGTKVDMIRSGAHVGSEALRSYIEDKQPILCMCGHIHESPGIDRIGRTLVVNAGPLMRGRYAVIEIEDDVRASLLSL